MQVGELGGGEEGRNGGGHSECWVGMVGGWVNSGVVGRVLGRKLGELEGRWVRIRGSIGAG